MKNYLSALVLVILTGCSMFSKPSLTAQSLVKSTQTSQYPAVLSHCVDGDTAHLFVNGAEDKVRFLAIDTPEISHDKQTVSEPYGDLASAYTCRLLMNAKTIVIEIDPFENQRDQYDRRLAWIWIDEVLLQALLIESGYAEVAFVKNTNLHSVMLYRLQELAIKNRKGIWRN